MDQAWRFAGRSIKGKGSSAILRKDVFGIRITNCWNIFFMNKINCYLFSFSFFWLDKLLSFVFYIIFIQIYIEYNWCFQITWSCFLYSLVILLKNTRTKCQSGTPFLDLGPLWFPYNIYLLHNQKKKKLPKRILFKKKKK